MLNTIIPMTGPADRFAPVDFFALKRFIPMNSLPLIESVIRNLRPSRSYCFIFICHQAPLKRYRYKQKLQRLVLRYESIGLSGLADVAVCTVLVAQSLNDSHSSKGAA